MEQIMERRRLIQLAGAFLASGAAPDALFAQTKQMTMVVPFPPGGGGDILARTVSLPFSETLHEKVVIFNRPGAGGNIGTSQVVKARPDGTTVGYVTNGIMCVTSHIYDRQAFDPLKDLEPVAGLTSIGLVLAVSPKALPDVRSAGSPLTVAARAGRDPLRLRGPGHDEPSRGHSFRARSRARPQPHSPCGRCRRRQGSALRARALPH